MVKRSKGIAITVQIQWSQADHTCMTLVTLP